MSLRPLPQLATSLAVAAACFAPSLAAAEPSTLQCVEANEQVQKQMKSGDLLAARKSALTCAQEACPAIVRKDCAKLLQDVNGRLPTVIFSVVGEDGEDAFDVQVKVDGKPAKDSLDGKPYELDPGRHELEFTLPSGKSKKKTVMVLEGQKNQAVEASFETKPRGGVTVIRQQSGPRPTPVAAIVTGSVGLAALIGGGVAAGIGFAEKNTLQDSCAPGCADGDLDGARTPLLVADIAVPVGGALLLTSGVLFLVWGLSEPPQEPVTTAPPVAFDFTPQPGGGFATVTGRF